jgi:lipopolysaccharide/colanic/teichoic acid biosynthesis glycosyltransferase
LFVQERIGKGGRAFRMFKFRTMSHNVDDALHRAFMKAFVRGEISSEAGRGGGNGRFQGAFTEAFIDPRSKANGNNGKVYKPAQASQITRLGRILRRTSLDELPQILNILKGEMSLVGPRPNVPWEVEEYLPWHYERLEVLPGLTGLAQVKGRSCISFDHIVKYDIEYIEKQSLVADLRILWWTLSAVFYGKGAE